MNAPCRSPRHTTYSYDRGRRLRTWASEGIWADGHAEDFDTRVEKVHIEEDYWLWNLPKERRVAELEGVESETLVVQ